jgi:hypothetical protein
MQPMNPPKIPKPKMKRAAGTSPPDGSIILCKKQIKTKPIPNGLVSQFSTVPSNGTIGKVISEGTSF